MPGNDKNSKSTLVGILYDVDEEALAKAERAMKNEEEFLQVLQSAKTELNNRILMEQCAQMVIDRKYQFPDRSTDFARQMRVAMHDMRLSARTLSKEMGMSQSAVSKYMSGERTPSLEVALRLAHRLHIDLNEVASLMETRHMSSDFPKMSEMERMVQMLVTFIRNDSNGKRFRTEIKVESQGGIDSQDEIWEKARCFCRLFRDTAHEVFCKRGPRGEQDKQFRQFIHALIDVMDSWVKVISGED